MFNLAKKRKPAAYLLSKQDAELENGMAGH